MKCHSIHRSASQALNDQVILYMSVWKNYILLNYLRIIRTFLPTMYKIVHLKMVYVIGNKSEPLSFQEQALETNQLFELDLLLRLKRRLLNW